MLLGDGPTLGDYQARMNQSTRGQWDWYASHRQRIERLITPRFPGQRICVLGAGNCNDLDLQWLCQAYAQVCLVDIDRAALERAAARQQVAGKTIIQAPIDLSGIAPIVRNWPGHTVSATETERALHAIGAPAASPPCGGDFDLALSPCVLSQLWWAVRESLGESHPSWPALKHAILRRHLRQLASCLRPGGRAVLAIDLSSTTAIPGLDRARESQWNDLMKLAAESGKCFRGLEPHNMRRALEQTPGLQDIQTSPPWLWHLGWGRSFLVYGLSARKIGPPETDHTQS